MTLHRPIPHPATAPARSPGTRARRPRRVATGGSTRTADEIALPSFQSGAAGRIARVTFVVGAATFSWAGVLMIARAALG